MKLRFLVPNFIWRLLGRPVFLIVRIRKRFASPEQMQRGRDAAISYFINQLKQVRESIPEDERPSEEEVKTWIPTIIQNNENVKRMMQAFDITPEEMMLLFERGMLSGQRDRTEA